MANIKKRNETISTNPETPTINSEVDSTVNVIPFLIGNLGLWYYRTFFNHYHLRIKENPDETKKEFAGWLQDEYKPALESKWENYSEASIKSFGNIHFNEQFHLETIYPGLICGIGYEHELGFENEFKLGFSFDHPTGLPYIPGSSVKGTLRGAFKHEGYPKSIINDWITKECPDKLKDQIEVLKKIVDQIDWQKMEDHIFEGKNYSNGETISSYQTDVFFDAFISKTSDKNENLFLADDYITCHQNRNDSSLSPFTNPNPVRFLKVRSDVEFTFGFRLFETMIKEDVIFTSAIKRELFKQILLDLGIGAKTNVGYGQFEEA